MRKAGNKPFVVAPRPSVEPQILLPLGLQAIATFVANNRRTPQNPGCVGAHVNTRSGLSERGIYGRYRQSEVVLAPASLRSAIFLIIGFIMI